MAKKPKKPTKTQLEEKFGESLFQWAKARKGKSAAARARLALARIGVAYRGEPTTKAALQEILDVLLPLARAEGFGKGG